MNCENDVERRLDEHIRQHPRLAERILRQLLLALHNRAIITIEDVYKEARRQASRNLGPDQTPTSLTLAESEASERALVERITRQHVAKHMDVAEVDDMVNLTLKRDQAQQLADIAELKSLSFRLLADAIHRFCSLPEGDTRLPPSEVMGIRVELIRKLINDQLEFIGIAKNYLRIRDLDSVTRRLVGTDVGMGRVGGKAGGMLLAHCILNQKLPKDPDWPLAMPESVYLRSDTIQEFLDLNRLNEFQHQKYKAIEDVRKEYSLIQGVFRNSPFPVEIVQKLRAILNEMGTHPLIVRSSSLLEDRIGTAFCGKYDSIFLANQGDLESRLKSLLGAIAEVYASTLGPDPILYRQEHNLIDYSEDMAVLIQKVVGRKIGPYYLPLFAGVAFSRNEYRWSPRIRREDGLLRLVMGLGTRAVERVGSDYPRMVALGAPTIRPESNAGEIRQRAQRMIDAIHLGKNRVVSVTLEELMKYDEPIPMLDRIVSIRRDGELYQPPVTMIDAPPSDLYITFDKLLANTNFAERIRVFLTTLEQAYGVPIDIEFAFDGQKLYLVQCRCQSQAAEAVHAPIPTGIAAEDVIFTANRYVRTGQVRGIEYVVYVDPRAYDQIETRQRRHALARVVGRLNDKLLKRSFILIGPGRWGSNDVLLGVPVTYADLNHAKLLIEVARQKGGYVPEVSFGTHFFQDLVEAGVLYLPLYPDEEGVCYSEEFLERTPNALAELLPEDAEFQKEIRVIDVRAVTGGKHLNVILDGEADNAMAYLEA